MLSWDFYQFEMVKCKKGSAELSQYLGNVLNNFQAKQRKFEESKEFCG